MMRNLRADKRQRLIREGKRVQQMPENIELLVKISKGFTIDKPDRTQPYEYFRVMAWTDAEDQHGKRAEKFYKGFHCFDNELLVIPLDSPEDQYLYIEFQRRCSWKDPGTSVGTIVMGRAKVPLPPRTSCSKITSKKVDLVGLNSDRCVVVKGHLEISMELHSYVESD